MAKYVQPNFIVDSSAAFLRNVTFDSSVYLQGVTHINAPSAVSAATPFALVLEEGTGSDLQVKSKQLGTMAFQDSATWDNSIGLLETDISNLESSVGDLDTLTQNLDSSVTTLDGLIQTNISDISDLVSYDGIQDVSIQANWDRWVDSNRTGFLNQTETTLSFTPNSPAGSGTFTLGSVGATWSYYRNGEKFTITGDKTVQLNGGASAPAGRYYIYIDSDDGTLIESTTSWSLSGSNVLVAYVDWDPSNNPTYLLGEERHTMLIDRRMHIYLHETRGTQFVSGGALTGPDVSAGDVTVTNANNAVGIAATEIADEDIFQTLPALARPSGGTTAYLTFLRTGGNLSDWGTEDLPFPVDGANIQYDDGTGMTAATAGKYVNSYIMFTNLSGPAGNPRFAILPGQGEFDTMEAAIDENPATFNFDGLPIAEYVIAWQLTWEVSTGYSTSGKVALASAPKRIEVNATTASSITTEDHNDLLGLQGGNATERYHLTLAQYNDYIGKTDVDSSLLSIWNELGYLDTSIQGLDTVTQTNASNISTNSTDIGYLETSVGGLDTLTQTHTTSISNIESSLGTLDTVNGYQDTSIYNNAVAIANLEAGTTNSWNGLTTTDNSVGLGGSLAKDTVITTGDWQLGITGSMQISGDLTVDGSITYLNTNELDVSDNIININTGLTGVPPVNMVSGMRVNRGSSDPYFFFFNEADDTFRIGINASEGGLPAEAQAVATREDNPNGEGIPFWNDSAKRFDTVSDFKFNATTGLTISDRITGSAGLTLSGLDASTQTYALMVPATGGGVVSTRALGTNAFSSDVYALKSDVDTSLAGIYTRIDGSLATVWTKFGNVDTSLNSIWTKLGSVDTSISGLDTLTQTNATDIGNLETSVGALDTLTQTHTADIAQLDASIVRIDASLNDVIEATDLFYTKSYIDGSFGLRDTSIAWLDTNKLNLSGGTLTGLLTLASAGIRLDNVTITNIDTSAEGLGVGLDTHIPTSAAVKSLVDSAISAGVTASNGLTENPAGNIKLGGALSELTTITATDASALKFAGITNVANEQTLYAESSLGKLITTEVGTMAFATASDYETKANLDTSLGNIWTELGYVETSLGTLNGLINTNITDIGNVETSLGTLNGLINTNITDIGNVETSLGTLNGLINTNTGNISTNTTDIGNVETSLGTLNGLINTNTTDIGNIETSLGTLDTVNANQDTSIYNNAVAIAGLEAATTDVWNGIELTDSSVGLGGALDYPTTITADSTNTLTIAGLQTLQSGTGFVHVTETASSAIKTKELGTMAWETATDYVPVTGGVFTGDVGFSGNVYFDGSAYFTDVETIDVSSGYIHLNTGLTGAPPPTLQSGIIVGRGSADPYAFVYDENTNTFRIGITDLSLGQYSDASTQAVATREDNPTDWGIGFWNETMDRIDTSAGFTFTPGTGLGLPIAPTAGFTTETTALVWNGTNVGSRDLAAHAFEPAVTATGTGPINVSGSSQVLSAMAISIDTANGSTTGALSSTDWNTFNNKIDDVASAGAASGVSLVGTEVSGTAIIKDLVAGAGTTITNTDASTVTISVTGAEGITAKYAYNFTVSGTEQVLSSHQVTLGNGPYNISVYEGGSELVYTGVDWNPANGNVTLSWSSGSLTGDCSVFITG